MPFVKLWDNILDNIKVQRLKPETFRAWVNLLAVTVRYGGASGELPSWDDLVFGLRADRVTIQGWLDDLVTAGLIDLKKGRYSLHDYEKWNDSKDKTAARRQKEWRTRNALRNALRNGVTEPLCNTPQELEGIEGIEEKKNNTPLPPVGGGECEPFQSPIPEAPKPDPLTDRVIALADEVSAGGLGSWAVNRIRLGDPSSWIEAALREGVDAGKLSPQYLAGILRRYRAEGGPKVLVKSNGKPDPGPTNQPRPNVEHATPEAKAAHEECVAKYNELRSGHGRVRPL